MAKMAADTAPATSMTQQRRDDLVVVSWNTQYRTPEQLELRQALAEWRPDALLRQEAVGSQIEDTLPESLRSRRWWPYDTGRAGIMIAARFEAEAAGFVPADGELWGQNRIGWMRLRLPDGPLTATVVHLLSPVQRGYRPQRDAQRADLRRRVAVAIEQGERMVVGGDFNTINPHLPPLQRVTAGSGATWRPLTNDWMPPLLRIDAIFASSHFERVAARVDRRFRGSDHLPVVVRLRRRS